MSLFEPAGNTAPLAARMRPSTLDELVGQRHALGAGSPLRRLIEDQGRSSVILWGPPGSGKTTIAQLLRGTRRFVELSAVNAGVKDVRAVIDAAKDRLGMHGEDTVLFIDEVHRFSKTQQDALLPAVEQGWITLIAATTENPTFSVISPLLSRSVLVTLRELDDNDVRALIERAIRDPRGLDNVVVPTSEAIDHLIRIAGGDARRALTSLEAVSAAATGATIDLETVERVLAHAAPRYDTDLHYDVISAFIKSIRGSDADAAMHWLARMVEAGEDPRYIARRLVILASEDIGLADDSALWTASAAAQAVALVGMPEGYYPLAHATLALALAPKSNSVATAMAAASDHIRAGRTGPVPIHLRSTGGIGYQYPHEHPDAVVAQEYAPIGDPSYYRSTERDGERGARWAWLRERLGRKQPR